jgi:hypothetical protein
MATPIPLQVVVSDNHGGETVEEIRLYYAADLPDSATTLVDLIEHGGMMFTQSKSIGNDAATVQHEVGDRATIVQVGPYDAALIWADPFFDGGRRSFNLFWSDGSYDFGLRAGLETPEQTVGVARSTYC